jgi:hypothetical protein
MLVFEVAAQLHSCRVAELQSCRATQRYCSPKAGVSYLMLDYYQHTVRQDALSRRAIIGWLPRSGRVSGSPTGQRPH